MTTILGFSTRMTRRLAVGALLFVFLFSWRESDWIHSQPSSDRASQLIELATAQSKLFSKLEGALPFLGNRLSSRLGSGLTGDASPATIQREVILSSPWLLGTTALSIFILLVPSRLPKKQVVS
jgi:hypothetical protein